MREAPFQDTPCDVHPQVPAGWRCDGCARALCPGCAAEGVKGLTVCATCGQLAQPLLAPRSVVFPFAGAWPEALGAVTGPRAIAFVVVWAIALQLLVAFVPTGWRLGRVLELAWLLVLVRRVGQGLEPFGLITARDVVSVCLGPLPRWVAGVGPVLLGAVLVYDSGRQAAPLSSPWPWGLAAAAVALGPQTLLAACVEGPSARAVWPWRLAPFWRLLRGDLLPLQGATFVAALGALLAGSVAPFSLEDQSIALHLAQAFVLHLGSLWAVTALGVMGGALLRTRAYELEHGALAEAVVPRLREAPTGRWVPPPPPEVSEAELARRRAPIELDDPREVLREAVARKDVARALAQFELGLTPADVDAEALVSLAQLVAGQGDFGRAAMLLRGVALRAAGPQTPRALVILGRLCVERLGAPEEGLALYRRVATEFPGTRAAAFALAQLQPPGAPPGGGPG